MTPYVFMIIIWVVLFYYLLYRSEGISEEGIGKRKKVFVVLSGVALFVIMGFRHENVGLDTTQYLWRYHQAGLYPWSYFNQWDIWLEKELGFTLVGKILYLLHIPDQVYLMLYALFIAYCISKLILKWCKNPFWGFYLHTTIGLFTMSMSGIRQSIACCICWLAMDYILEKKPIRFFLAVILASAFHQSAIFFVVFYFARHLKIKKASGWLLAGFSVASLVLRPILIPILEIFIPDKYEMYGLISDKHQVNPLLVLIALLIPMFCLFFWERRKIKDEKEDQFYSLCYAGSNESVFLYLQRDFIGECYLQY